MNDRDITGNPAPLGLLGFGMTTVLLNFHNAGFYELNAMILAMGICYGGVAQIIAGIMEWRKGNTFATTAFISYGFFWLSLVALIVLTKLGLGRGFERHRDGGVSRDVGIVHARDVHRHVAAQSRVADRLRHTHDFVFPARVSVISPTRAPASNISPVTKESSAASPRSTPVSRKCSTNFTAKSFCRSAR